MSNADVQVLPGFNRADALYLAECLEGVHGEGRRSDVETSTKAAAFIRAALALTAARKRAIEIAASPMPSLAPDLHSQR